MAGFLPPGGGGNNQTANPYEYYDAPVVEDDLIDPDDGRPVPSVVYVEPANELCNSHSG